MTSTTLRGRLGLVALAAAAIWIVALTAGFNLLLGARLHDQADEVLRTRAAAVAATLDPRTDGTIAVNEPVDDHALDAGIWIYRAGIAIERPHATRALQVAADALAGRHAVFADVAGARLYALAVESHGHQVGTVVASVALSPYRSTARFALAASAAVGLLIVTAVYPVTRRVVGRALRPVAEMSAQAAQWSRDGAAQRFGPGPRPTELAALATNLDALLDRLTAVLRHEQLRTAELSHELRTPLTRIIAEVDWLTARPREAHEQSASHEAVATAAERMRVICQTLLADAPLPGRCDVAAVAREVAARTAADYPHAPPVAVRGLDVAAGAAAVTVERILTPLVDNARRYARGAITVDCAHVGDAVQITVSDDGGGVPAGYAATIFDPGVRAQPADGHPGAGLGLPLARRLARAAGGDVDLADPRPATGARFDLRLPAA